MIYCDLYSRLIVGYTEQWIDLVHWSCSILLLHTESVHMCVRTCNLPHGTIQSGHTLGLSTSSREELAIPCSSTSRLVGGTLELKALVVI